ncbi:DegQ family serine endoprotease [Ferriphaselus sp. R-1]|uniref:DegQ family serine endoprotease n=1 Tax=Ferriphaselus sp. R-1 TaxID=1485544 RepID=UPI00055485B9|nr:DegQ family serine endoprotease [Ferriphaselus sp. R-1]
MWSNFLKSLVFVLSFQASVASARELPDFTELVEKQGPAVVNISTVQVAKSPQQTFPGLAENDPFFEYFRRFFPQQAPHDQEVQSLGSGFIISQDGYILTNAHVVDSADKITVRLTDKREFKAKVIGADRRTDVAVLKIEAQGLPVVATGAPDALKVGEWVVAIGSPFGFSNSVTAGIVSAKGRSLPNDKGENIVPFIQTDVAINPGNSGGPLFNMKGEVVGINSQIYSRSGGYMGLAFAIPIDVALDVAGQLRTSGKVTRGRIGVSIEEVTTDKAESFGLGKAQGALISSVEKDGPADKAGIRFGDVVLKFNGKVVATAGDLPRMVRNARPGSQASVEVWRSGAVRELKLTVGEMPNDNEAEAAPRGGKSPTAEANYLPRLGISVSERSAEQKTPRVSGGLVVEEVRGSVARQAGLQRGDVILAIGNIEIVSLAQFNSVLKQVPNGRNVALLVRRGEGASYVAIKLDER